MQLRQLPRILNRALLKALRDPKSHQKVTEHGDTLTTLDKQTTFPITNGIPSFLKEGDVIGNNAKYQKFYDKIGRFTGSVFWLICRLFRLDMVSPTYRPEQNVLETSTGAGANIPPLTIDATYVGVDISIEMLKACQKHSLVKPYDLHLIHANAEQLPFKDETFDVVFHFGGINFFNDIPQAIDEMIRVAKPGALILIGDETQEHVDSWYSKLPLIKNYFNNSTPVFPPLDLLPRVATYFSL